MTRSSGSSASTAPPLSKSCTTSPRRWPTSRPGRAADADRHQLRGIGDHRHRRGRGRGVQRGPPPGALCRAVCGRFLPPHCIVGNPLDLTGDANAERYRKVLTAAEGHYDVVMSIFGDPIPGASRARPEPSAIWWPIWGVRTWSGRSGGCCTRRGSRSFRRPSGPSGPSPAMSRFARDRFPGSPRRPQAASAAAPAGRPSPRRTRWSSSPATASRWSRSGRRRPRRRRSPPPGRSGFPWR